MSSCSSSSEACSDIMLASDSPKKHAGRLVFKETRHPVYRGVRMRNNNKWVSEVRVPNHKTRIWLGTYPNPEMAARAHDVAALTLRGKSACLNFANSAWRLPPLLPPSNCAKEIRRVAAEVAQTFAEEDRRCQQQQTNNHGEVSNSADNVGVASTVSVMAEDNNDNNDKNNTNEVVEEEQVNEDWLQSMKNEPLRSPLHIPFESSYGTEYLSDVLDPEVSLWSFSI